VILQDAPAILPGCSGERGNRSDAPGQKKIAYEQEPGGFFQEAFSKVAGGQELGVFSRPTPHATLHTSLTPRPLV